MQINGIIETVDLIKEKLMSIFYKSKLSFLREAPEDDEAKKKAD
jgi:hypothetical protein